ncbi:TlpA family protein disulfide reductase [Colwellia sp. MSW7]|uniref:TlpA family protein disulfide reductase n=1 Tax=Colwellia maritima TaxID=2912588 RepID=A0ABS9X1N8_9GAMM|nr:TlpA disulfide reductase family protein [Colwellia maritima]MCI2284153.1 TlpA family protein disulfide reductase [Colwellia maritima]
MQHSLKKLYIVFFVLTISLINITKGYAQDILNSQAALEQALSEHKGKVVYIDFWASWCGPCRKSFPWMNTVHEKYKQQGFSVISINLDADKSLAEKFLVETPANFSVIYDPKGKIAKHFKIQGMPSSMLIGRDGKIKSRHTGFFTNKISTYQEEIEQLLATHNE